MLLDADLIAMRFAIQQCLVTTACKCWIPGGCIVYLIEIIEILVMTNMWKFQISKVTIHMQKLQMKVHS